MKNRNKSLIVLAGAVTISAMFVLGRAKGSSLIATNRQNLSYGHYDTVLPSFEKPGSHEYWVCCETHEIRFEKPLEGIIYSEGAPSQEQIASWESLNDGRYIAPIVKTDASHFQYGFYPQKRVSEPSLLSDLNALTSRGASGYYELGEKYYLKNNAEPYDGVYRFDDGEAIVSGASYWFECSPIEWKILSSDNDEYFVISEKLLDVVCFNDDVLGLT